MNRCVLFDVDGTLFDTGEGIRLCVRETLAALECPPLDAATLDSFIGPSLFDSFTRTAGLTPEKAATAVDLYRERYLHHGLALASPYPGVDELLPALVARGYTLCIASSKPLTMVRHLSDVFGYTRYFARVAAPDYARRGSNKAALVAEAAAGQPAVMVGDTRFDIEGAHQTGIKAVAALYGYGAKDTLAAADAFVSTASELSALIPARDDLFA